MKTGMELKTLAQTIITHASGKEDLIAPTQALGFKLADGNKIQIGMGDRSFGLTDHANAQVVDFLDIPRKFASRLTAEIPDLMVENLNALMNRAKGRRMLRTMNGTGRSFLSDGYMRIDNEIVFDGLFPVLSQLGATIESCNVSDDFLQIQAIFHRVEGEVRKGDVVRFGVAIRNSEIGNGALSLSPLIYRLVCTNGMVMADHARRRAHIGGSFMESDGASWVALSSETQQLKTKAIVAEMGEHLLSLGTPANFQRVLSLLQEKADEEIPAEPQIVIESLAARYSLNRPEADSALLALAEGRDYTRWGLANAVTVLANTSENYDRAVELETLGGRIMQLNARDYKALSVLPKKSEIIDAEILNA